MSQYFDQIRDVLENFTKPEAVLGRIFPEVPHDLTDTQVYILHRALDKENKPSPTYGSSFSPGKSTVVPFKQEELPLHQARLSLDKVEKAVSQGWETSATDNEKQVLFLDVDWKALMEEGKRIPFFPHQVIGDILGDVKPRGLIEQKNGEILSEKEIGSKAFDNTSLVEAKRIGVEIDSDDAQRLKVAGINVQSEHSR